MPEIARDLHQPIRVLMVSKACLIGIYQRKLEEIAAHPLIDLRVVVPPFWKDTRGKIELEHTYTDGYELIVEPMCFNGNFHFHYYPGLKKNFTEFQPDIVHIDEEPYNLAAGQTMRLARQVKAKTLFFSWQNICRKYPPPFSLLEKWVLHHADAGIVGNSESIDVWKKKGYSKPITMIPQFGVDPEIFSPEQSISNKKHFVIGYAGRFVPEKGVETLIKAAALLPDKWTLRLLGDGPQKEDMARCAGVYNISGSVEFMPPVSSTDMPDFYRGLDALVLPSLTRSNWKEQFGRVLIEAMACGVPVIGSSSGAIPEVIGDAGLIFPEGNAEKLKDHLVALMQHPRLHQQLRQSGRERVLNHFTQQQIASQTVDIYKTLMGF